VQRRAEQAGSVSAMMSPLGWPRNPNFWRAIARPHCGYRAEKCILSSLASLGVNMKVQFLTLIAALGLCAFTAVRSSEPKAQLSYNCKPQIASGISFNDQQKEWVPTPFEPGKAFVLTLKYLGETTHKSYPGVFKTFDTYNITITYEGEDHKSSCIGMTLPDSDVVEVVEGDVVRCSRYFGDVFFSTQGPIVF
jgi:hypothetical protein